MKDALYLLLRSFATFVLKFYVKTVDIEGLENIPANRPILYTSSHFNSFFDSCFTHLIVRPKVHALARGDAFSNKRVAGFLSFLYILPIWRLSDGKRNMLRNSATFDRCQEVFKEGSHVLIYPEGLCNHQTEVLPLKNGTATMIYRAWIDQLDVAIVPLVINYDAYRKIGKKIHVKIGKPLEATQFDISNEREFTKTFTPRLFSEMEALVSRRFKAYSFFNNPLYALGWLLNFPFYMCLLAWIKQKFGKTVFYDSVFFGLLIFGLPVYWLLLLLIIGFCLIF